MLSLWAGAYVRSLLRTKLYGLGGASPLDPARFLLGSFSRRWAAYSDAPNLALIWAALFGPFAGFTAMALMPFPGSPLFAVGPVATGQLRPWNLIVLWVLVELAALSQAIAMQMVPDHGAQISGSRRLALFQSYLLPQAMIVGSLVVAVGTTDLLEVAHSEGLALNLFRLALGLLSAGLILARSRVGPFNTDAGLSVGEPDGVLPGQLLGLLRLGRAMVWLASTSLVVFSYMPMPASGWAALSAWLLYALAITAVLSILEAEQPAWHTARWHRVLWALGTPAGLASLVTALALRGG